MTLTIADEDEPPADFSAYISDGERIVNVTFPDESRRTKLDDTTWQVQLLPFQFMQYRATVVTTLTLEPVGGELRLSSTDLRIQGLPDEFGVNGKVWLAMDGALKPARTRTSGGRTVLGKLTVNLAFGVSEWWRSSRAWATPSTSSTTPSSRTCRGASTTPSRGITPSGGPGGGESRGGLPECQRVVREASGSGGRGLVVNSSSLDKTNSRC